MKKYLAFAALFALPQAVHAFGAEDTAPTSTETTTECTDGKVWDSATSSCIAPKESRLDDDTLYGAAREFAYAGQLDNAQQALAAMTDQTEDRVLTYWGFTHRKKGDHATGMTYYQAALVQNPDNILARSYMGQALVLVGDEVGAYRQLTEIRARGGQGSPAEIALVRSLMGDRDFSY